MVENRQHKPEDVTIAESLQLVTGCPHMADNNLQKYAESQSLCIHLWMLGLVLSLG